MTLTGKIVFIIIILVMYTFSFIFSNNANVRAIEKFFLIFFSISLTGAIIFSDQVWILLPKILQVYKGSDSVLYLFIIVSTSFNLIVLRKFIEVDNKLKKIVQKISIQEINKNKN